MQTFLPYESFEESFKVLDYKRLGKQRVEGKQIIDTIYYGSRWRNHPAVKMWIGYEEALKLYTNNCIEEWINRGYRNEMVYYDIDYIKLIYPWWLGNENFHRAMRARLIEKDYNFYFNKFPNDYGFNDGLYLWSDNDTKKFKIINNESRGRR